MGHPQEELRFRLPGILRRPLATYLGFSNKGTVTHTKPHRTTRRRTNSHVMPTMDDVFLWPGKCPCCNNLDQFFTSRPMSAFDPKRTLRPVLASWLRDRAECGTECYRALSPPAPSAAERRTRAPAHRKEQIVASTFATADIVQTLTIDVPAAGGRHVRWLQPVLSRIL
jgi:hypothetical protein